MPVKVAIFDRLLDVTLPQRREKISVFTTKYEILLNLILKLNLNGELTLKLFVLMRFYESVHTNL